MAIPEFTTDIAFVQKLADQPTETAQQLKETFDSAGLAIQTFLNSTAYRNSIQPKIDNSNKLDAAYLSNKSAITPSDITAAPAQHEHTKSQITDFTHTHVKTDVTDFAHTHTISEVTDLTEEKVRRIYYGTEVPASHSFPDGYVPAEGDIYIQYTAPAAQAT